MAGYNPIVTGPLGSGDPAPSAGTKINAMFQELYNRSPGALLSYTSPAGAQNNVTPVGFNNTIGRLEVTLSANSNWTGLNATGIADGTPLLVSVVAGAFTLTLNALNAGSGSANQFRAVNDIGITLNDTVQLIYYGGSVNKWVVVP